jgi:hypothetical protein
MVAAIRQTLARGALALPEPMRPQQVLNLLNRLGHPTQTKWHVRIMERYRHGAGVVTSLARYLRGGPLKNARLVAWDGERVIFTCRARHEEADGARPGLQQMTLPVADFLQRWLLHVPVPPIVFGSIFAWRRSFLMQPFEMGDQLRLTGPTAKVETEHLIGAFGRRAPDPQAD